MMAEIMNIDEVNAVDLLMFMSEEITVLSKKG
jgi:hypothetical protein